MPSIYNHENNACWGIRRTSYNIFNEPTNFDLNTNKADSTDCKEIKVENFHGSSNGYYGYVPTRIEPDDSCAMDTSNDSAFNEHNSIHVSEGQSMTYDVNSDCNDFWKRKRSHPVDAEDTCKRTKVEEPENRVDDISDGGTYSPQHNLPSDPRENDGLPVYNFYRCTMSHYM